MKSVTLVAILAAVFVAFAACEGEESTGAGTESNTISQAPFRVVDDGTGSDLASTAQSIQKLTQSLKTAKRDPLPASNAQDESFIENLLKTKETPTVKIPQQRRAADPYEISILSKIQDKMNVIRDAAARLATAQQQQQQPEPAKISLLRNLVASVKQMRKAAEQSGSAAAGRASSASAAQYQHDMHKLAKEERLYKQMRNLAESRYVPNELLQPAMGAYRQALSNVVAH